MNSSPNWELSAQHKWFSTTKTENSLVTTTKNSKGYVEFHLKYLNRTTKAVKYKNIFWEEVPESNPLFSGLKPEWG